MKYKIRKKERRDCWVEQMDEDRVKHSIFVVRKMVEIAKNNCCHWY